MRHKKKGKSKYGVAIRKESGPAPFQPKHTRKGNSSGTKILLGLFALILIGGVGYWQVSLSTSPKPSSTTTGSTSSFPQTVSGVVYSSPAISADGSSVSLSTTAVKNNKLTFVDLELQNPLTELSFQGRNIPLGQYKSGQYLPLIVVSTPSGNLVSGLRVCEPCGSFSFHIVNAKYLDCDLCHTRWDIETFAGVSGGCPTYPPPKLPTSTANNVTIDLSALGVQFAA